jgi:type II secretory pathway pseudopilin PulG
METLVLVGIFIVLLSIFIPYVQSIRESSRRINCALNLRIIRSALQTYARDNSWEFPRVRYDSENNPSGYTVFTGADSDNPFAADSAVQPNDVTASLWLLVRIGYIVDLKVFVCPSSIGTPDTLTDARGQPVAANKRGNFRSHANLTYSYAMPFSNSTAYRLKPDFIPARFALLADENPGASAASQPYDAPLSILSAANSPNHGSAGQNVVYGDNTGDFRNTPYCGVGYATGPVEAPGDNIYTVRQPTTQPLSITGRVDPHLAPIVIDDSYLVPTMSDVAPIPAPPPRIRTSAPTTVPTTTGPSTSTSAPSTQS